LEGAFFMSEAQTRFVYVTYIRTTPEKLWAALTQSEFTKQYWFGVSLVSDWKAGGDWQLTYEDGRVMDAGQIVEADAPRRLVIKWRNEWKPEFKAEGYSRCTMELEPVEAIVKLTVTHEMDKPNAAFINEGVSNGWPKILSNLKSLLETGAVVLPLKP
jgi:uncharacterized protein YndB with AHSA1/START domain